MTIIGDLIATAFAKVGKEVSSQLKKLKEQKRMLMLLKECSLTEDLSYFVTNSERKGN
jgi:hypothetical protein